MADLGTAYVRVMPDMEGLNARVAGYFSSAQWAKMGKVAGGALGAGIAAGGAVKALYEIGQAFDEANDKIRVGTGATGKRLAGLEKDFKKVVQSVPTDFGTAADAITEVNKRLDLVGRPLQQRSKQFLELSRLTGTDLKGNIEAVSKAFVDWEVPVKKQGKVLNGFFRLSQKTGIGVDDLARSIQEFGSPLRQLGFTVDEAAATFAQFEKAGVNTSTMVPGLKLAISNLTRPTAGLADSMDKLGISSGKPEKGLRQVFAILSDKSISQVERTGLAMDVFGKRAGADMAEAIKQGRFHVDKLLKTFHDGDDTIGKAGKATRDLSESWQLLKNRALVAIEPVATKVFDLLGKGMKFLADNFPKFKRAVEDAFSSVRKWLKDHEEDFRAFGKAVKAVFRVLEPFVRKVMDGLKDVIKGTLKVIGGVVDVFLGALRGDWKRVWGGLKAIVTGALRGALGAFKTFTAPFRAIGSAIGKAAKGGIEAGIKGVVAVVKATFNGVIASVNFAIDRINAATPGKISLPGPVPDIPGIPDIPHVASINRKGGLIKRFAQGGMVPSLVSSGELLAFPDGSTVQVPGARVAADNVLTSLPVGTAVFTGHGQQLLAGGASPAQALAAQLPHFAGGGVLSAGQLAGLARWAGLPNTRARIAGATAKGESSGVPGAVGDGGDSIGLWQINLPSHPWARSMNLKNPEVNARAMARISGNGSNFSPWTIYRTGAYRQFMGAAGNVVPWGRGASTSARGGSRTISETTVDRGTLRSAFSDAFAAGREGRSLRGVRAGILGALSTTSRTVGGDRPGGGGGTAAKGAPAQIHRMFNWAQTSARKWPGYVYGGGHGALGQGPFDCSGFVSGILAAGGFLNTPLTTDGLKTFGQAGDGKYISIGVRGSTGRGAHTMIRLGHGKNRTWWEAGSSGVGRRTGWSGSFPIRRHPAGFRRGGIAGDLPKRLRDLLLADPSLLDPHDPAFVGFGLRRGGIAGFAGGGTVRAGAFGPGPVATSFHTSVLGDSGSGKGILSQYASALGGLTVHQLMNQVKMWGGELEKASGATAARIRAAAALVRAQLGHFAGKLAARADEIGRRHDVRTLDTRLARTRAGINMDSPEGLQLAAGDLREDREVMRRRRRKLRRAREIALKAGDEEGAKALTEEIRELNTGIKEAMISWIETVREAVTAALQQKFDIAGSARSFGQTMFEGLELDQQLAGTFDTQAGRIARSQFITQTIIPLIQGQMEALKPLFVDALNRGDTLGAMDIWNQYFGFQNEIKGLTLDANDLLKSIDENTSETTQAMNDLLKEQLRLMTQRFQVSQAQYGVFRGLPKFADGGVVPGPTGAARLVVAHGGETVLPTHRADGSFVTVIVEDGAVNPDKIRVVARDEMRRQVRSGSRVLPGRGGGVLAG